jgi:probable HAF family extracellular repeat protein
MPAPRPTVRRRRRSTWVLLALTVSLSLVSPPAAAVPANRHVVDLGTLPGGVGSSASSISDTGFVTGASYRRGVSDEPLPPRAFLWHRRLGMVDLGTLGGPTAEGRAVNDWGEVTGCADTGAGTGTHPFLWSPRTGRMRNLDARQDTGFGCGIDVNGAHQVTGFTQAPGGGTHAFFWSRRTGQLDLGTLGGAFSTPTGINARGMVSGYSEVEGHTHAFVWTRQGIRDLGTLGGNDSLAVDLNDRGVVTGESDTADGTRHAFVWSAATGMRDLGALGSRWSHASAISSSGWVVGWNTYADPVTGSRTAAFVWRPGTGMTEVGGPREDTTLTAISARGQAVGWASAHTPPFEKRVIVWSPRTGRRDLATLDPGAIAFPRDINVRGRAVGVVEGAEGVSRATLWRP